MGGTDAGQLLECVAARRARQASGRQDQDGWNGWIGQDGTGWDGMGWDGMGWDGMRTQTRTCGLAVLL